MNYELTKQFHKLLTGFRLVEGSAECTGGGNGVLLLHTAHLHAHMAGFHHHHHTHRMKGLFNAVLDLLGHTLLHLQTMAVDVHHTGNLAQSRDVALGDVGDMGLAVEG